MLGLDVLPLGRVINDEKVTDHHAIIPTRAERHPVDKMSEDDRRIYDLVVRRFLAVFHPEAVFENTRVETTVGEHVFRTRGKRILVPGWRGVYGETADVEERPEDDEGREQRLPELAQGERRRSREVASEAKETKPPRRHTERSLAGHDGDRGQAGRRRGAARGDEGVRASARPPPARRSSSG